MWLLSQYDLYSEPTVKLILSFVGSIHFVIIEPKKVVHPWFLENVSVYMFVVNSSDYFYEPIVIKF